MKQDQISQQIELALLQKAIEKSVAKMNSRPNEDFCGLSSVQMDKVLRPVGSAGAAVGLRNGLNDEVMNKVPMFRLVEEMLRLAMRECKLELTKLGYLKRKYLAELYEHRFLPTLGIEKGISKLSIEFDWPEAGFARDILEIGRLVRRLKCNSHDLI